MMPPEEKKPPMAVAMKLANEVSSIGISFAIPPLGGYWLDSKWGTSPWMTILGALFGFLVGMKMLMELAKRLERSSSKPKKNGKKGES